MRNFIPAVSLATVLVACGFSAQAADLIIEPEVPVVMPEMAYDWTGFYAGVNAGGIWGTVGYDSPDAPATNYEEDLEGFLAGVQAGYNWQTGNLVFGLQSDFAYTSAETGEGDALVWLGSTTGRVGLAVDTLLLYGKAGVAYGMSEASFAWNATTYEESDWHVGWTAGLGAELALDENVSLFAEYDYVDLGSANYFANIDPIGPNGVDVDIDAHIVKAGVNFKF